MANNTNLKESKLAIEGGTPVRKELLPYGKQFVEQNDIDAVIKVLQSDWLTTGPTLVDFEKQFAEQVLGCINLHEDWRNSVLSAMTKEGPEPDRQSEIMQVDAVLANLRKQHLWGVISDKELKDEHTALQRQRRDLEP